MLAILYSVLLAVRDSLRRRAVLEAEILALRHELLVLQRSHTTIARGPICRLIKTRLPVGPFSLARSAA